MPVELEIRRARPDEAETLTRLMMRSKAVWGYDEEFMRRAAPELTLTAEDIARRDVWVGEVGGEVVGVSGVDHEADPPELSLLFVEPAARGTGAGRALLRRALAAAGERGIEAVVVVSDPNAEPFYRSQGAEPVGVERSPSTGRELPLLRIATTAA